MPPKHKPWWKADADADESDKLALLPSDAARWAWFRMMCRAKTQRRMGVFSGRAHLKALLGLNGRFVPDLVRIGAAHQWPTDCPRCQTDYATDAIAGDVVVHDYRREQRDPTAADRQARARERHGDSDGDSHADITFPSRAVSPSPSESPSSTIPGEPYPVRSPGSDSLDAMALVEELASRPFGWGPGSPVADTLIADVKDLGPERVMAEYRAVRSDANGSPIDVAGIVYGAHKRLYRIPSAPGNGRAAKPKGLQPEKSEVDRAFDQR